MLSGLVLFLIFAFGIFSLIVRAALRYDQPPTWWYWGGLLEVLERRKNKQA